MSTLWRTLCILLKKYQNPAISILSYYHPRSTALPRRSKCCLSIQRTAFRVSCFPLCQTTIPVQNTNPQSPLSLKLIGTRIHRKKNLSPASDIRWAQTILASSGFGLEPLSYITEVARQVAWLFLFTTTSTHSLLVQCIGLVRL